MNDLVSIGFIHPGDWSAVFGKALMNLSMYDNANSQRIVGHNRAYIDQETGAGQLHNGRTSVVRAFLDDSLADWLWFIDADMGFAPETVDRLLAVADPTDRPIVGGLCFAQKHDGFGDHGALRYRLTPTVYRMYETDDEVGFVPIFDYPRDQVIEVDATGAACFLVHRTVLEDLRTIHGDKWFSLISLPKGKNGFTEFGEDMSFFLRAKAAGFPVHVDTGVQTTHDKGGVFCDEETYDLQRAMLDLFPKEQETLGV